MIKFFKKPVVIFCIISTAALIAAFIVGISGNMPGLALCYIAAVSFILAIAHTWRKVRYFLFLLGGSIAGFFVFVILHNVFYGLGQLAANIIVLKQLLEFLHAIFFIIAVLVCPAAFLVGLFGSIAATVNYINKKHGNKIATEMDD